MTTIDSSTLHNNIVTSSQENLQENDTGANSMPTPSPQGEQQNFIVQSSPDEFDADARAKIILTREYTLQDIYRKINDYEKREHLSCRDRKEYEEMCDILFIDDYILYI